MLLEESAKRQVILHCHISEENKDWLLRTGKKLNRPMGDLVNEIITHVREEAKKEKDKKK